MQRLCLVLCRCCLSSWVGAGALFVVNGIALVTSPEIPPGQRGHIALLRFVNYYLFGFTLVGVGLLSLLASGQLLPSRRRGAALGLVTLALLIMGLDYAVVYRPLAAILAQDSAARPPAFATLHHLSAWINALHVGLILMAAIVINWPADCSRTQGPIEVTIPQPPDRVT